MRLAEQYLKMSEGLKFTDVYSKTNYLPHLNMDKGNNWLPTKGIPFQLKTVEKANAFFKNNYSKLEDAFFAVAITIAPYGPSNAKVKQKRLAEILDGTGFKIEGEFVPLENTDGTKSETHYAVKVVKGETI